jgi:hypothetical protein
VGDETSGARRRLAWLGSRGALGAACARHAVKRDHPPSVLRASVLCLGRRGLWRVTDLRLHQVSDDLAALVEHLDRVPEPVNVRAELDASDSVDLVAYLSPGRLAPNLVMIEGFGAIDLALAHFAIIPESACATSGERSQPWSTKGSETGVSSARR